MNTNKKPVGRSYKRSYYSLTEVFSKINDGQVILKPNALLSAFQSFEWGQPEILAAYKKLKPRDFYKTDKSNNKPGVAIDIYKAKINDERIYTHFYIDDSSQLLVINSFKENTDAE